MRRTSCQDDADLRLGDKQQHDHVGRVNSTQRFTKSMVSAKMGVREEDMYVTVEGKRAERWGWSEEVRHGEYRVAG